MNLKNINYLTIIQVIIILFLVYYLPQFQFKPFNKLPQQQSHINLDKNTNQQPKPITQETKPQSDSAQNNSKIIKQDKMASPISRLPSIFISHGLVGETLNPDTQLNKCLRKYTQDNKLQSRIKTAIIISGHWEENSLTVNLNPHPKVVHDHPSKWLYKYNFSLDTNIELAKQIHQKFIDNKIQAKTTTSEDIDHGGWGGLFCLYDIGEQQKAFESNKKYAPQIVQVSLHSGMDTAFHYKIGQILESFRDENTIIINSGASTHSFTYMNHPQFTAWSKEWEKYLIEIVTNKDEKKRRDGIVAIKSHKMYNYMHHSDDHFMPLLVAMGTSQYPGELICLEQQLTFMCSCYSFQ